MRLLHTSDWHLGATLEAASRHPEHAAFLDWLVAAIDEQAVDLLVVAGDVFDGTQPPADAQRLYFSFLARLARTRLAAAIVVGGNHDSAARLDAPADVLSALSVHVVGGYRVQDPLDRLLCPVRDGDGAVACVVAAVPFVHEIRLGVSVTTGSPTEVRERFEAGISLLYASLADLARARYGDVPLVATGHLAVGAPRREDYPQEIHQIGTIGAVSPGLFDPRYRYVALGHIHRSYPADAERRVWYSGSPVPISFAEATLPRRVLLVDLDVAPVSPRPLEVPCRRGLRSLAGDRAALTATLTALTWTEPEPPLCSVTLEVRADRGEAYDPGALDELRRLVEAHFPGPDRPQILAFRQVVLRSAVPAAPAPTRPLRELEPEAVFRSLCVADGREPADDVLGCFREILALGQRGSEP